MTYVEEVFERRRWDWITTQPPADESGESDADLGAGGRGDPADREA